MTQISYAAATVPVRADLTAAHEHLWQNLAEPGTWWTGAERVAIAADVRAAWTCGLWGAKRRCHPLPSRGDTRPMASCRPLWST